MITDSESFEIVSKCVEEEFSEACIQDPAYEET
jgi:hypothetical protein